MNIAIRTAEYIGAIAENMDYLEPRDLTNRCPGCQQEMDWFDNGGHIVMGLNADGATPRDRVVLVISCDEMWMIDPELVGIRGTGWMSDTQNRIIDNA
jgi:hypothetical protein